MNVQLREKLFDVRTSLEERNLLCEVAYGKSFQEALNDLRREDFEDGLDENRYKVLRLSSPFFEDGKTCEIEVEFVLSDYVTSSWQPWLFLYEYEPASLGDEVWRLRPPTRYTYRFGAASIGSAAEDRLRTKILAHIRALQNPAFGGNSSI